jgi:hypothetical protein
MNGETGSILATIRPVPVCRVALDRGHGLFDNQPVSHSSTVDPASVTEPVARALDALIVGAAASFVLSVAAVFATAFALEGQVHAIAHLSLPGMMGLVIVIRGVQFVRRHPEPREDAWVRARAVSAFDAHLARVLSIAVPLAWLVGSGAILVRHAPLRHDVFVTLGLWLPLGAALWILATFAWTDACRDRIAAGLDESDRRFRDYWRDIGRPG